MPYTSSTQKKYGENPMKKKSPIYKKGRAKSSAFQMKSSPTKLMGHMAVAAAANPSAIKQKLDKDGKPITPPKTPNPSKSIIKGGTKAGKGLKIALNKGKLKKEGKSKTKRGWFGLRDLGITEALDAMFKKQKKEGTGFYKKK